MKKFLFLIVISFVLIGQANAEAVKCGKMQGSMLNAYNQYTNIDFDADNTIISWSGNSIQIITDKGSQDFLLMEDNKDYVRGYSSLNGTFIVTYDKNRKKLFYSKQSMVLAQYYADCEPLE